MRFISARSSSDFVIKLRRAWDCSFAVASRLWDCCRRLRGSMVTGQLGRRHKASTVAKVVVVFYRDVISGIWKLSGCCVC